MQADNFAKHPKNPLNDGKKSRCQNWQFHPYIVKNGRSQPNYHIFSVRLVELTLFKGLLWDGSEAGFPKWVAPVDWALEHSGAIIARGHFKIYHTATKGSSERLRRQMTKCFPSRWTMLAHPLLSPPSKTLCGLSCAIYPRRTSPRLGRRIPGQTIGHGCAGHWHSLKLKHKDTHPQILQHFNRVLRV